MIQVKAGDSLTFKGESSGTTNEFAKIMFSSGTTYSDATKTLVTISSTDWGKALAGNYSATITFTAEVVSG